MVLTSKVPIFQGIQVERIPVTVSYKAIIQKQIPFEIQQNI